MLYYCCTYAATAVAYGLFLHEFFPTASLLRFLSRWETKLYYDSVIRLNARCVRYAFETPLRINSGVNSHNLITSDIQN